jgi:hypothetical protein
VRTQYVPRWARRRNLTRLQVSSSMVSDHMPDRVAEVVQTCLADVLVSPQAPWYDIEGEDEDVDEEEHGTHGGASGV